jgi:D-alanyl-D-alanine dipeptidase
MNNHIDNEAERRKYWIKQVELAYDFMEKMHKYPVKECGEPMVSMRQAVKDARLTVKFSDTKIANKYRRVFYLREGLIKNFLAIAKELNDRGWFLKVEDGFRTRNMQRFVGMQNCVFDVILKKVIWEQNGEVPSPELMLRRFSAFIATSAKVGTHISGSALDISVYQASNLSQLDRGGRYLELSELTFMDSPFISEKATKNRREIRRILKKYGFIAYPFEFWHFSQGDAYSEYITKSDKDARYGAINFDLTSGRVVPIETPEESLYSIEEIQERIESSLKRIK